GVAGLIIGRWTLGALVARIPPDIGASGLAARLDLRVLGFAAAATILSGVFFGLLPALRASRTDLQTAFKEQGASVSSGSVRLRKSLIVVQVAMTAMLLIASGLFGESLVHLERANLGMRIGHIAQFSLSPGLSRYSPAQTVALFNRLREDIAALPDVSSVSAAEIPLLADANMTDTMSFEGYTRGKNENTNAWVNYVSPHFFSTMGIPLVEGREFRDGDAASSPKVAIINEKVARKFFSGRNPIGLHVAIGGGPDSHPNIEIVGVVANAKHTDARDPGHLFVYFPYAQDTTMGDATFYVRAAANPRALAATLRTEVARDAPDLPIYDVRTLTEQLNASMFSDRLVTFFTLSLGLLAAVGLYGVMAYVVARRTREIGIRMALGAMPGNVARLILWQAAQLGMIGLFIGMIAAIAAARLIRSLLYGVKAADPVVFILSALLLIVVALVACYIPARRAMRVDPIVALRYE
ncbi:MAG TPA: ABC transporter permease, partial [Candidatus Dormibacteraeota bacterium]|nr:ABC transporter permease [Candidatus Dormibacteraeota bacterium]